MVSTTKETMSLLDFKVLSFDVYGTLIDWETGVINGVKPLTSQCAKPLSRQGLLSIVHELESRQQANAPNLTYKDLLTEIYPQIAEKIGVPAPSQNECELFGASVGQWPAFPDTVEALQRLSQFYKLVVLSNTDRKSFAATNAGPLHGVPFDLIITAEDVGTYKPDLNNFHHMLKEVNEKFKVDKVGILQTAQSQFHDHHPAEKIGIKSCWIVRPGSTMGNRDKEVYDWKFDTLGDLADTVTNENVRQRKV